MTERFGDLLARQRPWLLRQARRMAANAAEADDLVQDVMIKFTTHFQERPLPDERGCMAWMATALKNTFISAVRKSNVEKKAGNDPTYGTSTGHVGTGTPLASDSVSDEELARAVARLTRKQRDVFHLHAAGMQYAEIAAELRIRVNAVAKRLFDARQRLKEILKAEQRKKGDF